MSGLNGITRVWLELGRYTELLAEIDEGYQRVMKLNSNFSREICRLYYTLISIKDNVNDLVRNI